MISKCELVFFSHFRMNVNAGTCWSRLFLAHFTTLFQDGYKKFRKTDIVSMASPGKEKSKSYLNRLLQSFLYARTVTKSWCPVGMFFDIYTNFKFINWYPDVTIWILVQCTVFLTEKNFKYYHTDGHFREYQNKCFWRPECFGKAQPQIIPLQILSWKGAIQIMPFRKLGGKIPFFPSVLHAEAK